MARRESGRAIASPSSQPSWPLRESDELSRRGPPRRAPQYPAAFLRSRDHGLVLLRVAVAELGLCLSARSAPLSIGQCVGAPAGA